MPLGATHRSTFSGIVHLVGHQCPPGEGHRLWIEDSGTPMAAAAGIADWSARIGQEPSDQSGEGGPTDPDAARALLTSAQAARATLDGAVESEERPLADLMKELFILYCDETPFDISDTLSQAHANAQSAVRAAWAEVSAADPAPTTAEAARAALAAHPTVASLLRAPTNKGTPFGDGTGHPQARDAVLAAIADLSARTPAVKVPKKAEENPEKYASDHKGTLFHKGESLSALHAEIWDGTQEDAAQDALTDATR